jgi:hypothetical protein
VLSYLSVVSFRHCFVLGNVLGGEALDKIKEEEDVKKDVDYRVVMSLTSQDGVVGEEIAGTDAAEDIGNEPDLGSLRFFSEDK